MFLKLTNEVNLKVNISWLASHQVFTETQMAQHIPTKQSCLMGRRGLVGLFVMYKSHGAKGRRFESCRRLSLLKKVLFGEKKMKKKEEEEDLERVKREDRGRRRRQSNQELLGERLSVHFKDD